MLLLDDNEDLLLVEDGDGSHAAFVGFIEGQSAAPHAKSDVVFTKQGDVDFRVRANRRQRRRR